MGAGWLHAGSWELLGFEPWSGAELRCSWAGYFNLTMPLSTQVYKWVPASLMLGVTVWKFKEAICSPKCDMH